MTAYARLLLLLAALAVMTGWDAMGHLGQLFWGKGDLPFRFSTDAQYNTFWSVWWFAAYGIVLVAMWHTLLVYREGKYARKVA